MTFFYLVSRTSLQLPSAASFPRPAQTYDDFKANKEPGPPTVNATERVNATFVTLARNSDLWDMVKSAVSFTLASAILFGLSWYFFMLEWEMASLEHEGNADADKALEDLDSKGKKDKGKKGKEESKDDKGA